MAFGGDLEQQDEVLSEINMTPLVDVMLVLLIIFIITVPVLTHTVPLDLPQVSQQPSQTEPDTVSISIRADGAVFWDSQPVTREALTELLQQAAMAPVTPQLQIYGDKTVAYEQVLLVMAAAQQAGLTRLGFVTEPDH
ncbi:biopolymer transporter ExbD [Chromatiaceae bacterium AAb-1]|nr:biopolymer transporter ExbD [Chromatiaceae bacterium AAb-1]